MATKNGSNGNGVEWAAELGQKYASGIAHVFVLHHNVQDYVAGVVGIGDYLRAMLAKRDLVISYDIAEGITFAGPEQEALFRQALGIDQQAKSWAADLGLNAKESKTQAKVALPCDPAQALPLLERALHLKAIKMADGSVIHPRVAIIINWAEQIAPNDSVQPSDRVAMVTLAKWAVDAEIMANQGIVILVTRSLSDLAEPLRSSTSRVEAITVKLPDEGSRMAWISDYVAGQKEERDKKIEVKAWAAVKEAIGFGSDGVGWFWDSEGNFPWDDTLENAPTDKARKEAQTLLKKARRDAGKSLPKLELAMGVQALARATPILSLVHLEDIFLRAMHEGRPVDVELVKDRRDAIVRSEFGDVIELMNPKFGFDYISGHEQAKAYFNDYVIRALHDGDVARAPLGVLLMGPPGTGKSAIVEALAHECGFNAVNFNLAKILAGLVGASERNLDKALLAIEALAPCVVFVDEVDQKLGQRGGPQGDSGVGARLFGRVMEFMADDAHRGQIVWIAATNRPDLLDAAFKRPGRFDAKMALLLPVTDAERADLFRVFFKKYGLTLTDDLGSLDEAAEKTAGYTGAEIESIVVKSNQVAGRNGRDAGVVAGEDLLHAVHCIAPSTRDIEFMTRLALVEISDLELVPQAYREQAKDKVGLHDEIEASRPVGRQAREL